ncbi:hypothetical protein [Cellulomonas composti]|uniref:Secreted protein n=1 Tax=Cellulomonas composti TaxID=266130 RepID=A0A511J8F5_9CELL|nr:hypothetical protein [Cellulomonas composti]GEL94281.1 hypothetical protein CCO02nite_09390 [Cellulomonas composti]
MRRQRWGAAFVVALVLGGLAPAAARAADGEPSVGLATLSPGDVRVSSDEGGSTVSWQPDEPLPYGDARVEFALDGTLLGVPTAFGGAYILRVPGRTDVVAARVQVVLGGRVLAGPDEGAATPRAQAKVPAVTEVLTKDPGVRGSYGITSFGYTLPSVKLPEMPAKVEMVGQVVAPVGAPGKRPVVLFLHGRHTTCYKVGSDDMSIDWPCRGSWKPVPSYLGYTQAQRLLASQGYVTVSISANGINGQDGDLLDAGADARAILVRAHLNLLADWNAGKGTGPSQRTTLRGHLAMDKVMTVGHSRGGEGVQRAALQAAAGDRFSIAGQVLVAPTDFGQQVAVGVPTTVLLPYCDGDVSDLQGQMYVDQGARDADGDRALKSAVLVIGANHNYFNSQWTPGTASAPAWDDWWDPADAVCGDSAPQRLTATEQRAVGATYIAAAARTYLTSDASAVPLLDGTPVRAASAGDAVVLSHVVGGKRSTLVVPGTRGTVTPSAGMTSTLCTGADTGLGGTICGRDHGSPHWSPQAWSWADPAPSLLRLRWSAKGALATIPVDLDLRYRRYLDLRLVAPPQSTTPSVEVVFRDRSGKTRASVPLRQATPLPTTMTGHEWAQNVRVAFPAGIDRASITSIALRSTSSAGTLYVLDVSAAARGTASSIGVRDVVRLDLPAATTFDAGSDGDQTGYVRVPVVGSSSVAARVVAYAIGSTDGSVKRRVMTVRPGQKYLDVPFHYSGDDAYVDEGSPFPSAYLALRATRNAVVDSYVGTVSTRSNTPRPTVEVVDPDATAVPGESLEWHIRLTEPMTQELYLTVSFAAPTGSELTVGDLLPGWVSGRTGASASTPLSEAGLEVLVVVPAYSTGGLIEVPVRRGVTFTGTRSTTLVVDTSQFGPASLTLHGDVTA